MPSRHTRVSILFVTLLVLQTGARAADSAPAPAASAACPFGMARPGAPTGANNPPPPNSPPPAENLSSPPVSPTMPSDAMAAALDRYLGDLAARGEFSGTVLVAKSGKALFERGYGLANQESKVPITPETRFNIGSIGKRFTHTAICQLIAKGKLKPTSTLGELLPDYPNADARPATVEQLLNHSAGIANIFNPEFVAADKSRFRSNDDYYRFVAPRPLTAAPGARTEYCNGCYIVLGEIVERVSGMPYEAYVAENVFKTAGMTGAGFFGPGDEGVALGYTRIPAMGRPDPSAPLKDNLDRHGVHGSGAGGAYARARDLLAFDNALRESRLLERPMSATFFRVPPGATPAAGPRLPGRQDVAGGAPGINAVLASDGTWTIVVEANQDPPSARRVAQAITQQLMP